MIFLTDRKRHLICLPYTLDNLHVMADELGIDSCWFHGNPYPHYDIPKRRIREIENKCKIVSSKDIIKICKGIYDNEYFDSKEP